MLARSALARLAADVPKTSTHDLSRSARLVQRRLFSRNALSLPSSSACSRVYRAALLESYRSYATAANATKATPKVKRDVKKAVAKKPAVKKPAAKKAAPKKKPAKKAAAKKKPARVAKPKKELTPEKLQQAQEKKEKLQIKEYKAKALEPPTTPKKRHAWHIVAAEALAGARGPGDSTLQSKLKEASAKYQSLTPAEKEHYNHLVNEMNAGKEAEYTAWIRSHTPEEIRLANVARSWLRRKLSPAGSSHKYFRLPDERALKRPQSAFARFVVERTASGVMKGIGGQDVMKLCSDEWKALSASEKQKYVDGYEAERAVYRAEYKQVYGHAPDEKAPTPP